MCLFPSNLNNSNIHLIFHVLSNDVKPKNVNDIEKLLSFTSSGGYGERVKGVVKVGKKNPKLAGFVFISPNKVLKNYTKFEVAVDSAVGSCEVAKIIFSFFSSYTQYKPFEGANKGKSSNIKENSS